jgi:predicted DNA-binding protein (UPF0278 family)
VALLIVDAANVVGSVPNGWWRDRKAAARRLRDAIKNIAREGVGELKPPLDVVLVVEGQARGIESVEGVAVVDAQGSGDDAIVELVRQAPGETVVVTADRGLRTRVEALGAKVIGPRSLAYP